MEFLKIWEIILRRKWIIGLVLFLFFATFAGSNILITPSYKASTKVLIRSSDALSSLLAELGIPISSKSSDDEDVFETYSTMAKINPILKELITSLHLKDRDNDEMETEDLVESGLLNKLMPQPSVKIKQYEDTAILKITATSADPDEAAMMSNKLAELYIDYSVKRRSLEYNRVKAYFKKELHRFKSQYINSLTALKNFKINEQAVDIDTEKEKIISRLNDLVINYEESEKSLILLDKEIIQSEKQFKKLSKYRKETKEFGKSNQVTLLKTKLNDLLIEISAKGAVYQENHPDYKQIEKELETIKQLIKSSKDVTLNKENISINPAYDTLTSKLINLYISKEVERAKSIILKKFIVKYEEKLSEIPVKAEKLARLELSLSVNESIYEDSLSYLNKIEVMEAITLSSNRIVEPAEVPDKQNFPKKGLNYILGLFLGLFWGTTIAFFLEYIDNTVKSPADIEHIKQLNMLGHIPRSRHLQRKRLISTLRPTSSLPECYRTIRHNVQFAASEKPVKTILITSSRDLEGKSNFAANFALSFAGVQKRVLLLDLNLRRPALHNYFSLQNEKGITDIVRSSGDTEIQPLTEFISSTAISGIDLLTAGTAQLDPCSIIESEQLKQIIHSLEELYDIIIIDTPSSLTSSDATIVGTTVDYLIYIIECRRTTLAMVEHCNELIQKAGIKHTGCVLNKFNQQISQLYRGGSGYSSGVNCG